MNEGRRWTPVVPGAPDEPARPGQDRGRVHRASAQLVSELVSVVGEVPDLEQEGDEVEGQEDDPGADEADKKVEFEVGLPGIGPRKGNVDHEPAITFEIETVFN